MLINFPEELANIAYWGLGTITLSAQKFKHGGFLITDSISSLFSTFAVCLESWLTKINFFEYYVVKYRLFLRCVSPLQKARRIATR